MLVYTDRVAETSATVGTGNIALAGALDATYRAFAAVMSNGDTTDICIFGVDDFETCRATLSSGALVRGTVYASTNGGAHVDFGAGVKTVIMCLPEALSGTGIAVRIAADTWVVRSLAAPAAGITITNPAGIAGNPTFTLANDLA